MPGRAAGFVGPVDLASATADAVATSPVTPDPGYAPDRGPVDGHHRLDPGHRAAGPVVLRPPTAAELRAAGFHAVPGVCDGAFPAAPSAAPVVGRGAPVGPVACTHGGDYVASLAPASDVPALNPGYSSPGIPCYTSGPYVHVFYAYSSSGANRIATVGPRIRETVSRIDDIFAQAALATGATRHIRWLMSSCSLVISAVTISTSLLQQSSPTPIRMDLVNRGLMSTSEKALVFTDDGGASCSGVAGIGEWYNDQRTTTSNYNNQGAMLARVFGWCWANVGQIDLAADIGAHELSHTLGAVGDSAPNSSYRTGGRSHCTDGDDVMCYDDGGGAPRAVCPVAFPPTLDCNKDDYFNPVPPAGSYLATHWNTALNKYLSGAAPTSIEIPPRPSASLTSPGTSTVAGTVNVTATASMATDGTTVSRVEFWLGHTMVGSDSTAPYSAQFTTIPDATSGFPNGAVLQLVAVAVDAHGRAGPSAPSMLTIGNPKIRLTSPASWTTASAASVAWSAAASAGPGRTVTKVELLDFGSVIATDSSNPYSGTVTLADGEHSLTARVTDGGGVVRETGPRRYVRGTVGPTVRLLSPSATEYLDGVVGAQQRLVAAVVARTGTTISSVAFKVDGTTVNTVTTAPYEYLWTPSSIGSFTVTVVATDSLGGVTTSDSAYGNIAAPLGTTVTLTAPAHNASVTTGVAASASVSVPSGWMVDQVEFTVDGSTIATDFTSPYATPLSLAGYVGQHVVRAIVRSHDTSTSDSEYIGSSGTIVTLPGSIGLVAPASGATLAGAVTVTGSVAGVSAGTVAPLQVILGTSEYVASLWTPGLSSTFNSDWYEDGTTTLHLEDGNGYGLSSFTIPITLSNAFSTLSAPANNATLTGPTSLSASASADGVEFVEQVRFLVDGVEVGTDWYPPYQMTWDPSTAATGSHTIRAEAVITDGRTILSSARTVNNKVGLVTRLAGASRYETAAAISAASFAANVPVAYVATGLSFPDALAGAAVAGWAGGPVLLVPGTSIPTAIANELTRLNPGRIVVLGGTGVVSDGVKAALGAYTSGLVTRLAGASRYETAAAI
ncbi:MAG: Ig-like domain-containing protein, partial [Chloroflexota bacterium]